MSLFEMAGVIDGWNRAQSDGKPEAPSAAEYDAAIKLHGD